MLAGMSTDYYAKMERGNLAGAEKGARPQEGSSIHGELRSGARAAVSGRCGLCRRWGLRSRSSCAAGSWRPRRGWRAR